MSRSTPLATPVVPAPTRAGTPLPSTAPGRTDLVAPVVIVAPDGQHELAHGTLTVGRLPGSDVTLEDALVSRQHARLRVLPDSSIVVEDLHSTNGVYVNGTRMPRSVQKLYEGDRLLVGTSELGVFQGRARMAPAPRPAIPPVGAHSPSSRKIRVPKPDNIPVTDRADALGVIGRLAERLASAGNPAEAVRVLSGHLNKVLLGASAGLPVPEPLLDQATHYALELLGWSGNGAWIDFIVELHLALHKVPSEKSFALLWAALRGKSLTFDTQLFRYYVDSLKSRHEHLSLGEQTRVRDLGELISR